MLRSDRLVELRKAKGLIQQDIADYLNITRTAYNRYETGKGQPPVDALSKMSDYFNVSSDYLLGKTDDPTPSKEKQKEPKFQPNRMLSIIKTTGKDDITELAAQAGVDVMTYTHWFTGKVEPPMEKVVLIAHQLEVTTDYLMGRVDGPKEKAQKKEAPAALTAEALQKIAEEEAGRPLTEAEQILLRTRLEDLQATLGQITKKKD